MYIFLLIYIYIYIFIFLYFLCISKIIEIENVSENAVTISFTGTLELFKGAGQLVRQLIAGTQKTIGDCGG